MNTLGIALVWCVVQVTLVGLLAGALYLLVRKLQPAAGTLIALTGLLIIVGLSAMALSPWPRWSFADPAAESALGPSDAEPAASVADADATSTSDTQPPQPSATADENAAETSPSFATLFLQALADELNGPALQPTETAWRWPAVVGVLFLIAAAAAAVWLTGGLVAVGAYRARSRPIKDRGLQEQIDVLRAELGCVRPIELRQSDAMVTAATIGWRRPVILLPADWTNWTDDQRRAVLAHEIAHVRDGHFLAVLCGQLGLLLHFYHPLVHWLMRRLRLEQELAADAAAAGVTGGQQNYLRAIAELALRQSDRPLVWPARSFLPTRNTFLRRVAMLRDAKLRHGRLPLTARWLLLGTVLACAVLVAGLRGPANPSAAMARDFAERDRASRAVIDVSHIPSDAVAIVAVRPEAMFAREELVGIRELLNEPGGLGEEFTLPVEKIEQVTFVLLHLPDLTKRGPEAFGSPIGIVRAVGPYQFEELIEEEVPDAAAKEYRGATYYVSSTLRSDEAVFRPDDRTIIIGTERDVQKVIRSKGGPPPKILGGRKAWRAFQKDHAVVAVDGSFLKTFFTRMRPPGPLTPIAPLWEDTSTVVLGARLDDEVKVHAVATSDDEQGATNVADTVKAVQVLARNFMVQLPQQAGQWPESEQEVVSLALAMLDLVSSATVQRDGNTVRAESSGDLSSLELGSFGKAIVDARSAARRALSKNNLKQIALAMHVFHDTYKQFPPAVLHALPQGGTGASQPYSWRVALLPYLEHSDLYKQYQFDEPWDSPANRKLLEKMPAVYRNPKDSADSTNSSYFALTGPETVFSEKGGTPPPGGTKFAEIKDGTSNTIMIVEAKRSVPWTKPEDIPYDSKKPLPKLGGYHPNGFHAALCDGSVRLILESIEEKTLRAMITKSGGEVVDWPGRGGREREVRTRLRR